MAFNKNTTPITKLIDIIERSTERALYRLGKDILKTRIEDSKEKKTGNLRIIRKGSRTIKHISSKANQESDARISGNLNKNTVFKVSNSELSMGINKSVEYGQFIQKTRQSITKAGKKNIKNLLPYSTQEISTGFNIANDLFEKDK